MGKPAGRTGQREDNQQKERGVDVEVCPPPGRISIAGHPPEVFAYDKVADQLEHLLNQHSSEWRAQWGGVIERVIEEYRNRGVPRSPEAKWAFRAFDKAEREGRLDSPDKLSTVKKVIRDHTKKDRRQIDRWFTDWKEARKT